MKNTSSTMKTHVYKAFILLWALLIAPSYAEDSDIYTAIAQCEVPSTESYKFIFIVDNSGSMSSWEFTQSRNTINTTIQQVLNSDLTDIEVAIVQYGTNHDTREHGYNVTVPFTSDIGTATNWNRYYGGGTSNWRWFQDHQPGSLSRMRLDDVYGAGNLLDTTDATNVQIVFFTDALRDYWWGCCSSLVNTGSPRHGDLSQVLPGFGEYDALKDGTVLPNGLEAQFTILHVPPGGSWGPPASRAAAAIASPGGSYIGDVEFNAGDPEGPGTKPRRYVQGNFSLNDSARIFELIEQVIEEVKDATYTLVAPTISVNTFIELQHRDDLYFSLYQPTNRPRWGGNVKKFKISSDGVILDATGTPAVDNATGNILESARSYWSLEDDGPNVALGGYRAKLTNTENVYTDASAFEISSSPGDPLQLINDYSDIKMSFLDLATDDGSGQCVLIGERVTGTLTVSTAQVVAETIVDATQGAAKISFTSSNQIDLSLRLNPTSSANPTLFACDNTYNASSELQNCSFTVGSGIDSIDLLMNATAGESEVTYTVEYNIPDAGAATVCGSIDNQRTEIQSWLVGIDAYNENENESFIDAHKFGADPLHSKPVLVTYSGSSVENAKDVIFFSDNLGMLHAIDPASSSGEKLWSYLPEEHLDNAKKIILNKAGSPKVYGMDGHISLVQRLASDSHRTDFQLEEATLFVGERRGGRNYYSIDVSNAVSSQNRPTVNWKIHGGELAEFEDLGETWSRIMPEKIAFNCDDFGNNCESMEVLIFSGGYDPVYDSVDQMPTGTLGNTIYIVDAETGGKNFFWSAGNNFDSRQRHNNDLHLEVEHSIVATPTPIDTDGDGHVDIIFSVDISGNVWRIDLDGSSSTGSSSTDLITDLSAIGGKIAYLGGQPGLQRFYNALNVSRTNPKFGENKLIISAGSGYRAHPNEMTDTNNSLFVLFDANVNALKSRSSDNAGQYNYVNGDRVIRTSDLISDVTAPVTAGEYGRMLHAGIPGEKFLQAAITLNNTLVITSYIPGDLTPGSCSVGTGRAYFLDTNTLESRFGEDVVELASLGIPPEISVLRLPQISVCIGTNCASAEATDMTDTSSGNPCDSENFDSTSHGSSLTAAVSAMVCGLETGRAFKENWAENTKP